ncbi:MAG: methyl-accepting chemotaxis protein, partial [Spirochaetales bacterium]|nr:methyl-accepting chemotaxis protein [Spirochaetales bacterium]
MFKNMKLRVKLILVGTIIMVLPLVVVGYIAINRFTQSIVVLEEEQMSYRSKELAQLINYVFEEEKKLVIHLSIGANAVGAAEAVLEKGFGNADEESNALNEELKRFIETTGLGEDYQVVIAVGMDGTIFAASQDNYLGVSIADRQYFKDAVSGKVNTGAVGVNKVTGQPFIPVAAPIYSQNGSMSGVICTILDISFVNHVIGNAKIGKTGYAFVTDHTGLVIAHPDEKQVFELNIAKLEGMEDVSGKMIAGQSGVENYVYTGIPMTCGFAPVELTSWSIGLTLPDKEFLDPMRIFRNIVLVVGIIFFVISFLIYLLFARSIAKQLQKGVAFAETVARGKLDVDLDVNQKDEIGQLMSSLKKMLESFRYKARVVEIIASGDLTNSIEKASDDDGLGQSLLNMSNSLNNLLGQINMSVDQVNIG